MSSWPLTGYHRKHALRLLNGGETCYRRSGRPRSRIYDEAVHEALIIVWESADRICSKRLKALMPVLVGALERHGHLVLGAKLRELLLSISAATIDRLLAPQRAATSDRRRRRQSNGLVRSPDSGAHLQRLGRPTAWVHWKPTLWPTTAATARAVASILWC